MKNKQIILKVRIYFNSFGDIDDLESAKIMSLKKSIKNKLMKNGKTEFY